MCGFDVCEMGVASGNDRSQVKEGQVQACWLR